MIGGMMTPAGSSHNLLAISLLVQHAGLTIPFIKWMAAGIPLTIVALPLAWLLICGINKPAEIDSSIVRSFINNIEIPKKMSAAEIKTLVITLIMLTLWILSSWIRSINVMVVALLGACAFCLPGINVFPFKKFASSINWEAMVLVGTVLTFGPTMVTNKVSDWVITLIPSISLSPPVLIGFISLMAFLLLIIIPVGSTLLIIMSLPFISLAAAAGGSPVFVMFAFGIVSTQCYLLPLDTVPLLTYSTGYYSMRDMAKTNAPLQIGMVILLALWVPVIGKILGF
jgi:sodium-dependent dicarboxylate transporter 2/3/5